MQSTHEGARIIAQEWMKIQNDDRVVIITGRKHKDDAEVIREQCSLLCPSVDMLSVDVEDMHVGILFDKNEQIFDNYTAIIAATDYSLVTTRAAQRAMKCKKRFLSLPLSTNDGKSMLTYNFLQMDTNKSRLMASVIMDYIKHSSLVNVTTASGTDLRFDMSGRSPGFFNGDVRDGRGFSSASIEVYIPVIENKTEGIMIVDGSLGYIGRAEVPTKVTFSRGRVVSIENTSTGVKLAKYMRGYEDPRIYVAGELGIGLNTFSKCSGRCYIEDESTYGTFHIGLGRNIALGGKQRASGHFDLVSWKPDIYFDNRLVMKRGEITLPEFPLY